MSGKLPICLQPCFQTDWNHFKTQTRFHKHTLGKHVISRVFTKKNAPPTGGHVFQATGTTFKLIQDIIGTNHLTKFHDDRTINVASRVLTRFNNSHIRKNAPPPGSHVFQPNSIIFELVQDIIGVNLLTKKNAPPLGSHAFKANATIFKLIHDIIETNLLTNFHEDWKINVASRVFTSHIGKNAPPLGSHVFQANVTIFKLIQDIIETNLPTIFHEDWTINVASRVLTRKTAPPPGGNVFSPIWTIFALVRDINETNVLTKFHDNWAKIVTSRVFTRIILPRPLVAMFFNRREPFLNSTNISFRKNILTSLHEDWASNVTSTVLTSFELSQGINGTDVLTKFHEDQTINVASRVFTRQNVDDGRRTTDKKRSQKLTMRTLCSGELKRAPHNRCHARLRVQF
ncbi:hypothetical protein DPMN_170476 [Dreissena polymorpha]|uniref:Uncharacterized protein n=1 Tax=Dreissena polymorpha TaxID=45954 RepID=A0A9D4DW95_DREPO|nr:hypothetical protein DPMN_170476 [Dreissena polymorpha]